MPCRNLNSKALKLKKKNDGGSRSGQCVPLCGPRTWSWPRPWHWQDYSGEGLLSWWLNFGVPCSSRQVNLRPLQVGLPLTKPHIDIRVGYFTISPLATARVIYYVIRVVIRWTASLSQPGRVKRFALLGAIFDSPSSSYRVRNARTYYY